MSQLFDRLSQLYTKGHNGEPPDLFGDQRLEGIETFHPRRRARRDNRA